MNLEDGMNEKTLESRKSFRTGDKPTTRKRKILLSAGNGTECASQRQFSTDNAILERTSCQASGVGGEFLIHMWARVRRVTGNCELKIGRYRKVSEGIGRYRKVSEGIGRYRKVSEGIGRYRKVSEGIGRYRKVSEGIGRLNNYQIFRLSNYRIGIQAGGVGQKDFLKERKWEVAVNGSYWQLMAFRKVYWTAIKEHNGTLAFGKVWQ
ncbi:hypothetical protein [Pedosphaera parvula]|uniref:Uncharacterized protein n=1 Tax=Pedosphaera parvula (strain Ellin514) TaxID=320771 RepID=B9XNI1_PEDPL|nr:hypothetical protein [Pedosphaera parvula]EEF58640.1 hypothetical protein Cflav_PD1541 [Pedosphaera parvula Ellin514]